MNFLFYTSKFRVVYYSLIKIVSKYFHLSKFLRISYLIYFCFYKYLDSMLIKINSVQLFVSKHKASNVLFFLKNNFYFNCQQILDFTIVDRLELSTWYLDRYEYIYVLLSVGYNIRIFLRGFLMLIDYLISISKLFSSVIWLEREVWDMFGVFFYNHTNLRRILTDYGFLGHPLRKDFPLSGYTELRYDDIFKAVVIEPIELLQEFRYFILESAWYNVK